jgi:hypothetical protein
MTNSLRNATITKDSLSIEAIIYANGDIYALLEDSDADLLPYNVQTVEDCLICGFMILERG